MFELIGMREIRTPNSYKGITETSKDEYGGVLYSSLDTDRAEI